MEKAALESGIMTCNYIRQSVCQCGVNQQIQEKRASNHSQQHPASGVFREDIKLAFVTKYVQQNDT